MRMRPFTSVLMGLAAAIAAPFQRYRSAASDQREKKQQYKPSTMTRAPRRSFSVRRCRCGKCLSCRRSIERAQEKRALRAEKRFLQEFRMTDGQLRAQSRWSYVN